MRKSKVQQFIDSGRVTLTVTGLVFSGTKSPRPRIGQKIKSGGQTIIVTEWRRFKGSTPDGSVVVFRGKLQ